MLKICEDFKYFRQLFKKLLQHWTLVLIFDRF